MEALFQEYIEWFLITFGFIILMAASAFIMMCYDSYCYRQEIKKGLDNIEKKYNRK
jgi:Ca2+-dependent lipid-binding protein